MMVGMFFFPSRSWHEQHVHTHERQCLVNQWIRAEITVDAIVPHGYQSIHRPTHRACQQTFDSDEWYVDTMCPTIVGTVINPNIRPDVYRQIKKEVYIIQEIFGYHID